MDIEKTRSFEKSSRLFILKSLKIHFNPLQNVSLIALFDNLVMLEMKGRLLANVSNKETDGDICSNLLSMSEIFQM